MFLTCVCGYVGMSKIHTHLEIDEDVKTDFQVFCLKSKITMSELTQRLWKIHMDTHGMKSAKGVKKK